MLGVGFTPPELRTSTLEDFIEGFRRRVDVPGARRRDDGDEEVAHGIRGRRPGEAQDGEPSCLFEGKRYLLGRSGGKRRGSGRK